MASRQVSWCSTTSFALRGPSFRPLGYGCRCRFRLLLVLKDSGIIAFRSETESGFAAQTAEWTLNEVSAIKGGYWYTPSIPERAAENRCYFEMTFACRMRRAANTTNTICSGCLRCRHVWNKIFSPL